jgi:hypothetical protein
MQSNFPKSEDEELVAERDLRYRFKWNPMQSNFQKSEDEEIGAKRILWYWFQWNPMQSNFPKSNSSRRNCITWEFDSYCTAFTRWFAVTCNKLKFYGV